MTNNCISRSQIKRMCNRKVPFAIVCNLKRNSSNGPCLILLLVTHMPHYASWCRNGQIHFGIYNDLYKTKRRINDKSLLPKALLASQWPNALQKNQFAANVHATNAPNQSTANVHVTKALQGERDKSSWKRRKCFSNRKRKKKKKKKQHVKWLQRQLGQIRKIKETFRKQSTSSNTSASVPVTNATPVNPPNASAREAMQQIKAPQMSIDQRNAQCQCPRGQCTTSKQRQCQKD